MEINIKLWKKTQHTIKELVKSFDTKNHHLLLSKLKAYDFKENSVTFIRSYLTNRNELKLAALPVTGTKPLLVQY